VFSKPLNYGELDMKPSQMSRNKLGRLKLSGLVLITSVSVTACGGGTEFDIEEVAPIVNSAAPTALRVSATASIWQRGAEAFGSLVRFLEPSSAVAQSVSIPTAAESLEAMFTGTFGKISGGNGTGYINSLLEDMDARMSELESRASEGARACLENAAQDHVFDLGVHADAQVTLPVQCRDVFEQSEGEQSKPGSGLVFGQSDTASGVMLLLKHRTSTAESGTDSLDAGFGYAAVISDRGTDAESVQMVFGQFNTSGTYTADPWDAPTVVRLYAKPSENAYELAMAGESPSTGSPIQNGSSSVGCGFHMKSNADVIYAKGNTAQGMSCASATQIPFEICLNASDLSEAASGACDTLRDAESKIGTLTAFDHTTVSDTADNTTIFSGLKITSDEIASKTTSFNE